MGTGNLLNPSWTNAGDGMGGGGGFGDVSSGPSYYYGTGIGQPLPGESYGNFLYIYFKTTRDLLLFQTKNCLGKKG